MSRATDLPKWIRVLNEMLAEINDSNLNRSEGSTPSLGKASPRSHPTQIQEDKK